ncbi:hypothetical protein [Caulobacter henricii]|uniref:Uncharacterized protein n=1 Tax=Caulobacter henricii TaxID=69395 RepID=A0A0P0P3Y3_9CAUL|nr:hypothetical protein [Caulobacter henricii]ALL15054.1 hypothetical protein AQ619_17735 [Caulobacter henricii]
MGDAFWLVESPANRGLAEAAWRAKATDPNSALFKSGVGDIDNSDVLAMFETVELHHPDWSRIDWVGVKLSKDLNQAFREDGFVTAEIGHGFSITRNDR